MNEIGENLRQAMRRWPTGVSIVTSRHGDVIHGLTANSFVSISIDPPLVAVTLANTALTYALVMQAGIFAVTVLADDQVELSDRFAGHPPVADRFAGVEIFEMATGAPLLRGGLAWLDCRVVHQYPMPNSTLFVGEVVVAQSETDGHPLVYNNRSYHSLGQLRGIQK